MNINYNIVIRIITPPIPKIVTPKLSFKTVGASVATICLVVSEVLPFVDDIKGDGLFHASIKYFEKKP